MTYFPKARPTFVPPRDPRYVPRWDHNQIERGGRRPANAPILDRAWDSEGPAPDLPKDGRGYFQVED